MAELNPHYISELNTGASMTQIQDSVDYPHTGLFKALMQSASGCFVVKNNTNDFDITQAGSNPVVTVAVGSYLDNGELKTTGGSATFNIADFTFTTSKAYYLIVIDSSGTVSLRIPTGANRVANHENGDTIIAMLEIADDTAWGSRKIQFLTSSKTKNSVSIARDASGVYTEMGKITADSNGVTITGLYKLDTLPTATVDSTNSKIIIQDGDNSDEIRTVTAGSVGELGKQNLQGVTDLGALTSNGIEAASFTKTGGTSSQFLKADGTVDSNTYITGYTETQDLHDVTSNDPATTNAITTGGLTNNGKQIFDVREVNATNFGVGYAIDYRSYYINEPSGGIVMNSGTEGQIINIKNINSTPLTLNFATNQIEQGNTSNDHRLTPANIVTLQQWEGITIQYVNDGVTGPPSWYIVDTDETGGGGAEINDLTASVTWANVPDANITESSVTQHREAIQDRVIVETGNDSPAASAAEAGNYFYRASGETATFTIPNDSYVGEYYVLMNNSGSSVTISKDAGDTLIGSTSVSDGAAVTVICVAANTWFVIG